MSPMANSKLNLNTVSAAKSCDRWITLFSLLRKQYQIVN
jgi:hypothetical protein